MTLILNKRRRRFDNCLRTVKKLDLVHRNVEHFGKGEIFKTHKNEFLLTRISQADVQSLNFPKLFKMILQADGQNTIDKHGDPSPNAIFSICYQTNGHLADIQSHRGFQWIAAHLHTVTCVAHGAKRQPSGFELEFLIRLVWLRNHRAERRSRLKASCEDSTLRTIVMYAIRWLNHPWLSIGSVD